MNGSSRPDAASGRPSARIPRLTLNAMPPCAVARALAVLALLGLAAPWLAVLPAGAAAVDPTVASKVDGALRYVLHTRPTADALSSTPFAARALPGEEPVIEVVVRLSEEDAELPIIEGLIPGTRLGAICTGRLPVSRLSELARSPRVTAVEASALLQPFLDHSIPDARIDEVWTDGYTGDGVLVGVIDTGIDFRHDDFRLPTGDTRIKYLYERTSDISEVVYTEAQINAALVSGSGVGEIDDVGHGTHVTATATGNGRASSGTYTGAARDANIVFYKAWTGAGLPISWVIDGLNRIKQRADQLDMPVVVNLSLGTHFGAHDGSSLLEQAIDNVSGAGCIVVTAAGNDGDRPIHFSGGPSFSVTTNVSHDTARPLLVDYVWFEIWYEGTDAVTLQIQGPNGFSQSYAPGAMLLSGNASSGSVYVDNAAGGVYSGNGDKELTVVLGSTGSVGTYAPADGEWTFTFTGASDGPVHGWIASAAGASAAIEDADYTHLVAVPATSRETIAVGAHVSRTCWPRIGGTSCASTTWGGSWAAVQVGQAAPFTSPGPTRDGRLKPEISAPGMEIMAALSGDAGTYSVLTAPDGRHHILQGTSVAAPHVTGAVALLLDLNPEATPEEIRDALIAGASGADQPQGTGIVTVFDESFEGSLAGWSIVDGGSVAGDSWSFGTAQALSPTKSAICAWGVMAKNEALISPPITVPAASHATLDFWHGADRAASANGDHAVGVRVNGSGGAFTPVRVYAPGEIQLFPDPDLYAPWVHEMEIDLSRWAGETVEIAWTYLGTNADAWFVDDVQLTAPAGGDAWNPWIGFGRLDAREALNVAAAPVGVHGFQASYLAGRVEVRWVVSDPSVPLGFVLTRSDAAGGPYAALHEGLLPPDYPMPFVDAGVAPGVTYYYELTEHTESGITTYGPVSVTTSTPGSGAGDRLVGNIPNPFRPQTTIRFTVGSRDHVRLEIYDLGGRRVRTLIDEPLDEGLHEATWNGRDDAGQLLGAGIYFYRLRTGESDLRLRMAMIR